MKILSSRITTFCISIVLLFLPVSIVNAQTSPPPSGRMWVYNRAGSSMEVIDRASNTSLGVFDAGGNYSGFHCGGPRFGGGVAFDPTDGNIWVSVVSNCGGDGWIHKIPAMGGADITKIPDPTSGGMWNILSGGIGALDYDPEDHVLYAISYFGKGDGTGSWIFKLNPNDGSILNSFQYPRSSAGHMYTLAIAHPDRLGGRKVLMVSSGGATVDPNTGAYIDGIVDTGDGWGLDEDEVTGEIVSYFLAYARADISLEDGHRCDCPMIPRPQPQMVSTNWPDPDNKLNWSMQVEVSDSDGLVVRDVKLGQRYMAEKISVPYFNLTAGNFSKASAQLKPNGAGDAEASSRLIDYHVHSDDQMLVIEATYLIDRIPATSKACLHITQRYEFYKEGVLPCELSGTIKCSNFKPLVRYAFFDQGELVNKVNVVQRIRYKDGGYDANTTSIFSDCDGLIGCGKALRTTFKAKENPLFTEFQGAVLANGQSNGSWDNIHLTYEGVVEEPGSLPLMTQGILGGCPECVHTHWRWGSATSILLYPTPFRVEPRNFNYFQPFLPKGSTQDLDIAVVRYWPGEEDPLNYLTLVNNERIRHPQTGLDSTIQSYDYSTPDPTVVWYSATGHQRSDIFFIHPNFFAGAIPDSLAPVTLGDSPDSPAAAPDTTLTTLTSTQDKPTSVKFAYRYLDGPTTYESLDPSTIAPLPQGYTLYSDDSYNVITEAETSGPDVVSFDLSSVTDPAVFSNLRILHAETDQADPDQTIWVDRTILSPDTPGPDFPNKTLSARVKYLGPFVIVTAAPLPNNGQADLSVTIGESSDPVVANSDLTYTLNVTNNGPDTATDVILVNGLSPQTAFVSATSSYGTCKEIEGNVTCKLNPINAGANASVSLVVKPIETVTVIPPEGINVAHNSFVRAKENDGITSNNQVTELTRILPDSNSAPAVDITSPTIGSMFVGPANITITVAASDIDGTVSSVDLFDNGELLGSAQSLGGGQYNFAWSNIAFGNHALLARATDNLGKEKNSGEVSVFVNGLAAVSISNPVAGVTFNRPANISITANASHQSGNITSVDFYANGFLIGTGVVSGANQYSMTWSDVASGHYALTAVATDDASVTTISSAVDLTVNDYPEISLTAPTGSEQYTSPANINLTAKARDVDGSIGHVTFYANGAPICSRATVGALDYACTWNNAAAGNYLLTAVATDNSGATTTSNAINVSVNAPPTVSMTSPASGTQYVTPTNVVITSTASDSDGSINRVEFYANGSLIGTGALAGQNQYTLTWTNAITGDYTLTVLAVDNRGATATSNSTSIRVLSPALFVVGSTTLSSSDSVVKTRLEALNYVVTVKSDSGATTADANGKAVVVISSTVTPSSVGTKFRTVAVPVVTWESGLFANMGMTGSTNKDFGTVTKQTQVNIINTSHPMADGMNGQVGVTTTSGTLSWGKPNANAVPVASIVGDTSKIVIFGYEQGATMPGLAAPARRVGLFMHDTTAANFYTPGQRLFDAAIKWATGRL